MGRTVILWIIFFVLGLFMINYPFLSIFDKKIYLVDIPIIFIYLYIGWGLSIVVVYIFSKKMNDE